MKELIDNILLTFKRNISRVDVLINRPCNSQGKRSLTPLVIPYSEESNKVWETNDTNISKSNVLVPKDPVIASGKAVVGSSSKDKIPKFDKGKSSVGPYPKYPHITPGPFFIPYG